jgi:hypothetical protein
LGEGFVSPDISIGKIQKRAIQGGHLPVPTIANSIADSPLGIFNYEGMAPPKAIKP